MEVAVGCGIGMFIYSTHTRKRETEGRYFRFRVPKRKIDSLALRTGTGLFHIKYGDAGLVKD